MAETISLTFTMNDDGTVTLGKIEKGLKDVDDQSQKTHKSFGDFASGIVQGIGQAVGARLFETLVDGIRAVPAALLDATAETIAYGGALVDTAAKYGIAIEAQQKFAFAGGLVGISIDQITNALGPMQRALVDSPEKFARLGLAASQLRQLAPEQQFEMIAARIGSIKDPAERSAAAVEIFGKAGIALLPMMNESLEETMQRAEDLGLVMSEDVAGAADDLGDTVDTMSATWSGLVRNFASAIVTSEPLHVLLNGLTDLLGELSVMVSDNREEIRAWVDAGVVFAAQAIVETIKLVGLLIDAWSGLKIATTVVSAAIEDFGTKLFIIDDLVRGNISLAEAETRMRDAQVDLIKRTTAAINEEMQKNRERQAVAQGVVDKVQKLADAVANSAGVQHKAADDAERHGDALGKNAEAAAKAAKAAEDLARAQLEADAAMREANVKTQTEAWKEQDRIFRLLGPTVFDLTKGFNDLWSSVSARGGMQNLGASEIDALVGKLRELQVAARSAGVEIPGLADMLGEAWRKQQDTLNGLPPKIQEAKVETIDWSSKVRDLAAAFDVLGIDAKSSLGQIMGGLSGGIAGVQNFMKSIDQIKAPGAGFMQIAGGIVGGITQGLQAAQSAIQIGKAVFDMFSESPAEKAAKQAGKTLGVEFSEEMGQEIVDQAEKLGITVGDAILLHLGEAMDEGRTAEQLRAQIGQLMEGISSGSIPAKEGLAELDEVFDNVRESAELTGVVGDRMTVSLLQQAKATGTLTAGMKDYLASLANLAAEGAAQIADGMSQITATVGGMADEWGQDSALFFAYGFTKAIEEQGILGAIDSLGDGLNDFWTKMEESGNEGALAMLAPFKVLVDQLGEDGDLRGALTNLEGVDKVFRAMAESGDLTTQGFEAMQRQVLGTFNALSEGGVTGPAALQAIFPSLRDLVSASEQYGFTLDANTQALVDQAKAAGFAFPPEPQQVMIDLLSEIVQLMGGELPESARRGAAAVSESFGTAAEDVVTASDEMLDAFEMAGEVVDETFASIVDAAGVTRDGIEDAFAGIRIEIPVDYQEGEVPGGHGGVTGGGQHGTGNVAQHGAIVAPVPGGSTWTVGEGGEAEVIAPVRSFMGGLKNAIVSEVVAAIGAGGGGGGTYIIETDGVAWGRLVSGMTQDGRIEIHERAIVREGSR